MKHIYQSIALLGLGLISLNTLAQKDTTLTRQVMLEREYNPTLKDAARIDAEPALYHPSIQSGNVKYAEQAPALSFAHNKLGQVSPGNIGTEIPFSKHRGYLHGAFGNYTNLETSAGYRILDTKTDKLDVMASFDMANGKVKYRHKGFQRCKQKAKYNDFRAKIKYEHTFIPSVLDFDAGFASLGYNYYGNPYLRDESLLASPLDLDSKQKVNIFSFGAGLKSSATNNGWFKYKGHISYDRFKEDKGLFANFDGRKGGILNLDVDLYSEYFADSFLGIRGKIMNQSFGKNNQYSIPSGDLQHSLTNITVNPYYRFESGNWMAELGLNASAMFDSGDKFVLSPNIKARMDITDTNTLYANIGGGVNDNTFLDMLQENRYIIPLGRVMYSRSIIDLQAGFKSGAIKGLEFDVFAGFKHTRDDHMFISSALLPSFNNSNMDWGNTSLPVYANISTGHFGALVKTNLIPFFTVSAKMVGYFYNVKKLHGIDFTGYEPTNIKAWGKPTFTTELTVDIKPIDKLTCSATYYMALGRKTFSSGKTIDMKDINEVNLRAEYQLNSWFSLNGKINNAFNQKYELVQGYTLQGFSILGGFGLKF